MSAVLIGLGGALLVLGFGVPWALEASPARLPGDAALIRASCVAAALGGAILSATVLGALIP